MTVKQVPRSILVKQTFDCIYRDFAFHLADSETIRRFMGTGFIDNTFNKPFKTNIYIISPPAWEAINR